MIRIQGVNPDYVPPSRATDGSVGLDVSSVYTVNIPPFSKILIPLGFKMEIEKPYYITINIRSSWALKGITCHAGIIDNDYRAQLMALIYNTTDKFININKGDKFVQLVTHKYYHMNLVHGEVINDTQRGGGFGSTN